VDCWHLCVQSGTPPVPWDTFLQHFSETFSVLGLRDSPVPAPAIALAAILGVDLYDKSPEAKKVVTDAAWQQFLRSFSPITNVTRTLKTIHELVCADWFFGQVTQDGAADLLMFESVGTFLVRFSQLTTGIRGQFTLSYVAKDSVGTSVVHHLRLGEVDPSRICPHIKFLTSSKTKKKLISRPCPTGRPTTFVNVPKPSKKS